METRKKMEKERSDESSMQLKTENESGPGHTEDIHRQLVQGLPVAVYTCNKFGFITSFNDAAEALWGRTPETGKTQWCGSWKMFDAKGQPVDPDHSPLSVALNEGRTLNSEMIIERPNGEILQVKCYPRILYDAKGNIEGGINTQIDITPQIKAHKENIESEVRTRLAVEAAEMGTFEWDIVKKRLITSPRLNEIFGLADTGDIKYRDLMDAIHPEDRTTGSNLVKKALMTGSVTGVIRLLNPAEKLQWIKVYGKVVQEEYQKPKKMYGIVMDITEEKYATDKLKASEEQFRQIADLLPQIIWTVNPDGSMDYHNKQWYDYINVLAETQDTPIILHPDDDARCKEAFARSMKTGEKYEEEFRLSDADNPGQYRWFLGRAIPVKDKENNIVKWLGTSTDIDDHKNFSERLEEKVKERTIALNEKNDFVQTLLDSSVDMIIVLDKDLRIILLNKTAEDVFREYFPEQLLGKTIEEVDPLIKEKESYKDMIACLAGKTIYRGEVKSNAGERYFDLHYVPIKNEKETYAVMLITREVTESVFAKKTMEDALAKVKERNEFIETIIDASQNYIAVYDTETRLVSINLSSESLLNDKRENVIGKTLREIFPNAKGTRSENDLLRALSGEVVKNDVFLSPITGRYIQNYLTPLRDPGGNVYAALVTAYDMTDIKKSEEEIKFVNYQLTQAQRLAHLGSWEWDLQMDNITWTDELYRILGVERGKFDNTFENYLNMVHKEDRAFTEETVNKAIHAQIPFDFLHRIVLHNGTLRTVHAKGEVFTNEKNETILLSGTAQDITETVEMELKLRQSEIRHHLMIDQIEDYAIIFLNAEGYIEDWNKGAEKIKGYKEEEITGKHFSVFYPKEEQKNKLPEKLLEEARTNKKAFHEGWRMRKDGTRFWASVLITALTGENHQLIGFSKLTRDLTEQKMAAEQIEFQTNKVIEQNEQLEHINNELADQKAFAELLIESNPLMIFSCDRDFIVRTWNREASISSNRNKKDVLGRNMFEVFPEYNNNVWKNAAKEVMLYGRSLFFPKIKLKYRPGWGESYLISLRNTKGEIIGLLCITKDITETVKMNEDIERNTRDLEKMNAELASFSYIASHDLQEPLRKILTFSSRLMEKHKEKLEDESVVLMNKIETSAYRMKTLIQNLLDYSRLITSDSQMEATDLNEIMKNVLNDFELLIEQKNAQVQVISLPVVHAIPLQMNQLFYNLLSNALKFSRADTPPLVTIESYRLTPQQVVVNPSLNPKAAYCEIIFSDNGIGFDQKFAEKIFITFQRLNSVNDYPGTGIGLALSKKIVENHAGLIYAEAKENEGSVFHIMLPLSQPYGKSKN